MIYTQPARKIKSAYVDRTRWVSQLSRRPVLEFPRIEPQVVEGVVKGAP